MIRFPDKLQKGDLIKILAPAKAIEVECVLFAQNYLEKCGFIVSIGEHCLGQHDYFSGTVTARKADFQEAIDHPEVKAILCARGGYGCIQFINQLDWTHFLNNPKWIIGFSDVTVFHQHLHQLGIPSIHGTMPLNFSDNSPEALDTLIAALTHEVYSIEAPNTPQNTLGTTEGTLIGGNLSIIYSLIGTKNAPDFINCILFIEDVGEALYSIDRMFYSLKNAGILDSINGLIVGGMTGLKDSEVPFGQTYQEIILAHAEALSIPVCFEFPAGHINDNRALRLGSHVQLEVTQEKTVLSFTK